MPFPPMALDSNVHGMGSKWRAYFKKKPYFGKSVGVGILHCSIIDLISFNEININIPLQVSCPMHPSMRKLLGRDVTSCRVVHLYF